jgi:hypothetical protein|tara:strand:- start:276 stop:611 length:336 start_codon:yes stop_codon:yes gene_type:complete
MSNTQKQRPLVYICQPLYDSEDVINKAKHYCRFLTNLGYNPFSPCLYYSSFLDFKNKKERQQALTSAIDMIRHCEQVFIFGNYVSSGMYAELESATLHNKPIHYNLIHFDK